MWVWQSHAPAGIAKLTAVAGCEALVQPIRPRASSAAAPSAFRLVIMQSFQHSRSFTGRSLTVAVRRRAVTRLTYKDTAMDPALYRAWTQVVTADDYERHMAAIGQAQAGAELTRHIIQSAHPPHGGRVAIAGAGTGQMFDFLDPALLRPFHLTCSDLNPAFLTRLRKRLNRHALAAEILEDDIERTALEPGPDLLLATLLLEHIDWR